MKLIKRLIKRLADVIVIYCTASVTFGTMMWFSWTYMGLGMRFFDFWASEISARWGFPSWFDWCLICWTVITIKDMLRFNSDTVVDRYELKANQEEATREKQEQDANAG